jgi:hypothetical protein
LHTLQIEYIVDGIFDDLLKAIALIVDSEVAFDVPVRRLTAMRDGEPISYLA